MASYKQAIAAAQGLLEDQISEPVDERNAEYARAIVELIADTFAIRGCGPYMDQRKARVARDIGIPESAIA